MAKVDEDALADRIARKAARQSETDEQKWLRSAIREEIEDLFREPDDDDKAKADPKPKDGNGDGKKSSGAGGFDLKKLLGIGS